MSARVFVDAPVLVGAEDGADAARQSQALAWIECLWRTRGGRLSMQVLNEFYLTLTRTRRPAMPAGDARAKVRRFAAGWHPWQTDPATLETAWAMEARHALPFRDCLVLAAAQHSGCALLLSEALPHQARYGAVQAINPFLISVNEVLTDDER